MVGSLGLALQEACVGFADAPALVGPSTLTCGALTYRALAAAARDLATRLADAHLHPDEPVHVLVSNQPLDVAALFGVWLAGGVAIPIHRTTPPAVAAVLQQRTGARIAVDLFDDAPGIDPLSTIAARAPARRPLLVGAALIVFTSGSTGVPKGVVIAHRRFHGKIDQIDRLLRFDAADRVLLVLNMTFSFGLWLSLLALLRGATLVMQSKFEPAAFADALTAERITRVGMVPTMMRVLFADAAHEAAIERLAAQGLLRQILIGGESLGRSLGETIRKRFPRTALVDIYGLTETATCDFFAFPADYAAAPGCIGRPSPGVRHRIVDIDGRSVADGTVGELQIDTPYRMQGYLDEPALTAAAFEAGWLRTGDLACALAGGRVALMGRLKEVISRGGNKVTPVEIEQSICSHADIAAAMAVGIDDALLGQRIHVLVVPRSGAVVDVDAMSRYLGERLERYKHPDVYYLGDGLPLGRTGKADRAQLVALIASGACRPMPR